MAYGLEIYNASGNTVLSYTSRVTRFAQYGTVFSLKNSNTDVTAVGMENNDSWEVFLEGAAGLFSVLGNENLLRLTLNTGFFTISNLSNSNTTFNYWVLRT
jgi:hypothetical protein